VSRARRIASLTFDLTVAVLIVLSAVAGTRNTPSGLAAIGVIMGVALVWRRRWPLAVLAVVAAAALAQVLLFAPALDPRPFDVAVVIAMYSVVKYAPRMLDAWLAAGVVAVGIGIEVVRHPETGVWGPVLIYGGVTVAIWLSAYVMRTRRLRVALLEERAATLEREREHLAREREHLARIAVADERATIARELHDIVAHSLSVMIVQADGGRYAFDTDPALARQALATVAATGREALADMRRLVGLLRGTTPDDAVVDEASDWRRVGLAQLAPLVERARSAGLTVSFDADADGLPPSVELTVTRLVQESLTNALRHAGPGASVRLRVFRESGAVRVSCVDDGGGTARLGTADRSGPGHGLLGMRERVAVHQGSVQAGPLPGGGWRVEAVIPLDTPAGTGGAGTTGTGGATGPGQPAVAA
jgi:signal transduction histidine kinase